MGVNTAATQVMIPKVYAVLLAFVVVREYAALVVDGITSGNRARNRVATAAPIATKVPINAHPSPSLHAANSPASKATAATTAAVHDQMEPADTLMVTSRNTARSAATAPSLSDSARASALISPSVLSAMKIAPWVRNSATVVSPPSSPTGFRRVNRFPVYALAALIGRPITTFVSATPHNRAGSAEPAKMARSQRLRQGGSSTLPDRK